jgi:hypothetical protein
MGIPATTRRLAALAVVVGAAGLLAATGGSDSSPVAPDASIRLVGPKQVVFDWSREACVPSQAADLPVRAFRDDRGRVQLLLSHFDNFRMLGPSLHRLHVDCRPVMTSAENGDPSAFRDREWIASPYTEDGRTVWALVHDEYQGNRHRGRCPQGTYYRCWYNAITLAVSRDSGRSFHRPRRSGHLVAAPPYRYRAGKGPAGIFAPSNIVERDGDWLYALVRVRERGRRRGVCLIRSGRIASPGSWRAWDGDGFSGVFTNPYRSAVRPRTDCTMVASGEIAEMTESLTYNIELGRFLLLGMAPAAEHRAPRPRTGIYYSTSTDLVHWSPRQLLLRAPTVSSFRCGGMPPIAYPSLIDPSSRSRTFATTGSRPFLYYTQFHYRSCRKTPDRDLIRVRLEISS